MKFYSLCFHNVNKGDFTYHKHRQGDKRHNWNCNSIIT